jgi:hypothetical protein
MDVFWRLAMGDLIMFRQMGFGVAVALPDRRHDRAPGAGQVELVRAGLAPLACPG